ncbi:unnamed protein product [Camellia sinensis]
MEAAAEGLWGLADHHEKKGEIGKAVKCLEAICQSQVSFLPIVEVKTRLRISTLLLKHSHNVNHAKSHLERCGAYSLLSQCYHLVGAIPSQKQILNKGLTLAASSVEGFSAKLWFCNFNSQLANALIIEGDYQGSISALESGYNCASEMFYTELQWDDVNLVERAVNKCNEVWESIQPEKLLHIFYLLRICDYKNAAQHVEKLDVAMKADMQQMRHIQELTKELNALNLSLSRSDLHYRDRSALSEKQAQLEEQLSNITGLSSAGKETLEPAYFGNVKRAWGDKLELAPSPIDGEWLPKSAVYALVELMVVIFGRPKGLFKECGKRIQSGLQTIQDELVKLGINDGVRELYKLSCQAEVDLQHSAIWMAGVYLMLLMQFLENKVAVELTRSEFVEAQEALVQMRNWFIRFPTILQACESIIEMLRGQYAHSVGSYSEAAFHFIEAAKLTQSKSMQAMCQVYAAVSYICIGGPESSAQAFDLIGPVYRVMDSFVGVREKTSVLFAYGFLLMRQENLQDARYITILEFNISLVVSVWTRTGDYAIGLTAYYGTSSYFVGVRLATGLQIAHTHLGNLQLVSQYLTILGNLALALHDTGQAREILRSALTLAKKLYDIPTQVWVLSNLTALYQQLGENGNEMENVEFQNKKMEELQKRLDDARSSIHHIELIDKTKIEVHQLHELDIKRAMDGPSSMRVDLDIPESVGLSTPAPTQSSRLIDLDIGRRGKRRI